MPRTNRYLLPDHVWHITHRCHKNRAPRQKLWGHNT